MGVLGPRGPVPVGPSTPSGARSRAALRPGCRVPENGAILLFQCKRCRLRGLVTGAAEPAAGHKRTGRAGLAPTGEEVAQEVAASAEPERVRCAGVPKEAGTRGPCPPTREDAAKQLAPRAGPERSAEPERVRCAGVAQEAGTRGPCRCFRSYAGRRLGRRSSRAGSWTGSLSRGGGAGGGSLVC
jgi:hypothetical protein